MQRSARNHVIFASTVFVVAFVPSFLILLRRGEPPPDLTYRYSFAQETSGWRSAVWINGQPALQLDGSSAGLWSSTQFVVDGENEVRISARRDPEYVGVSMDEAAVRLRLVRSKHPTGLADFEELQTARRNIDEAKEYFEAIQRFDANVPFRWRWQDADLILQLPDDDRMAILAVFDRLVLAFRSRDGDEVRHALTPWWPGKQPTRLGQPLRVPDRKTFWRENIGYLPDTDLFIATREEIQLVQGSRVVMMHAEARNEEDGRPMPVPLISYDHDVQIGTNQPGVEKEEVRRWTVADVLYFIRIDGEWHVLPGDWRI
jgi:hypothetical protein